MEAPGFDQTHRAGLRQAPRSSPANEVLQRAGQEELGGSSKTLSVDDFELVRTLGTGMFRYCFLLEDLHTFGGRLGSHKRCRERKLADMLPVIGTFARVWLARLKGSEGEGNDQLYALKVLRKVEGKLCRCCWNTRLDADMRYSDTT